MLDRVCLGRGDLDTLAVEPAFTCITHDPELVGIVVATTSATCLSFLFFILIIIRFILCRVSCMWLTRPLKK